MSDNTTPGPHLWIVALTDEEHDLILAHRAEQAKRDAAPVSEDADAAPTEFSAEDLGF